MPAFLSLKSNLYLAILRTKIAKIKVMMITGKVRPKSVSQPLP